MNLIRNLPKTSVVNKNIPKNTFHQFIDNKTKTLFTEQVKKITLLNKLAKSTINLDSETIKEILLFQIELKEKTRINQVLDAIDKAIPHPIIFIINFEQSVYYSTAVKHLHNTKINQSVLDWRFNNHWSNKEETELSLILQRSLNYIHQQFIRDISGCSEQYQPSIDDLIEAQKNKQQLEKEIAALTSKIRSCKQFNKKVELNSKLRKKQKQLESLLN